MVQGPPSAWESGLGSQPRLLLAGTTSVRGDSFPHPGREAGNTLPGGGADQVRPCGEEHTPAPAICGCLLKNKELPSQQVLCEGSRHRRGQRWGGNRVRAPEGLRRGEGSRAEGDIGGGKREGEGKGVEGKRGRGAGKGQWGEGKQSVRPGLPHLLRAVVCLRHPPGFPECLPHALWSTRTWAALKGLMIYREKVRRQMMGNHRLFKHREGGHLGGSGGLSVCL